MKTNVTPGETPEKITVSMIDEDLNNGITKPEMAIKYGIKSWEVAEMFKHPFLKGRRPSKKKPLSFSFVDDITDDMLHPEDVTNEQRAQDTIDDLHQAVEKSGGEVIVDPKQITLEDAIEESTKEIETAVNELKDVNNAIVDMLGPTDETPEKMVEDILSMTNENGQSLKETFDKELEEEELEMDDDEFEL